MAVPTPWRVVNSLLLLRAQINVAYPFRSKASDGTVADDAHATTSDHYPHRVPALGANFVVTALDITHDPARGCDTFLIADAIRRSRDPRVKYVISYRRIASNPAYSHASDDWNWRSYDGSDPHTNHMHVSVLNSAIADDETAWQIDISSTPGGNMPSEWHTGEPSGPFLTQGNTGYTGQQRDTALAFAWQMAATASDRAGQILARLDELSGGGVTAADVAGALLEDPRFEAALKEAVADALARVRIVVDPAI